MKFITSVFKSSPEYKRLNSIIEQGKTPAAITGLSHIHKMLMLSSVVASGKRVVLLCSEEGEVARMAEDLKAIGIDSVSFPYRDFTLSDVTVYSREYEHKRNRIATWFEYRDSQEAHTTST